MPIDLPNQHSRFRLAPDNHPLLTPIQRSLSLHPMSSRKKKKGHDPAWAEAKKRCRLNMRDIEMAKKLGFAPKSLLKNIPSPSQPWKLSVKAWIHELYEKRFGEPPPPAEPTNPPAPTPGPPLLLDESEDVPF